MPSRIDRPGNNDVESPWVCHQSASSIPQKPSLLHFTDPPFRSEASMMGRLTPPFNAESSELNQLIDVWRHDRYSTEQNRKIWEHFLFCSNPCGFTFLQKRNDVRPNSCKLANKAADMWKNVPRENQIDRRRQRDGPEDASKFCAPVSAQLHNQKHRFFAAVCA